MFPRYEAYEVNETATGFESILGLAEQSANHYQH